jgi:hypothetical protein
VARVVFDIDDVDAAFEELDARYLAGEAATHTRTWSAIVGSYASYNRHEHPATTPDWVTVDHRPLQPIDDFASSIGSEWDVTPDLRNYMEAVHQLSDLGAVVTHAARGTTTEGFDAEWRMVHIYTVDGDLINRCELFDETDIDAALARFDELSASAPQLENAATRVLARGVDAFNRRDLDSFLAMVTEEGRYEDRRKGLRDEGPLKPGFSRTLFFEAPTSWQEEVEPVAIRGPRLLLVRVMFRDCGEADRPIAVEALVITEVTDDELISCFALFDPDDINGAIRELTARWIASGEVAHPEVIERELRLIEAANRHDWDAFAENSADATYVNHRQLSADGVHTIAAHMSSIQTMASLVPDMRIELAEVLAHSASAVMTHLIVKGTSTDGVVMELPIVVINLHDGDHVTHMETFDFDQRDLALARFEELNRPMPRLENAAVRLRARAANTYNRRDVEGFLALAGGRYEDRRKGLRDEGAGDRKFAHAVLSETPTSWRLEIESVAIRGDRLALTRETFRDSDEVNRPITVELMTLTEVADDGLASYTIFFDPDDIIGATRELTARWIASGEVAHPEIIAAVDRMNATVSRHDWDAVAAQFAGAAYVNHRQLAQAGTETIADWLSSMRTLGSLVPDFWVELADVLARSAIGIVGRMALKGTSTDGAAIEIPYVLLIRLDGDRVIHFEAFDENQRDLALARFQEHQTTLNH